MQNKITFIFHHILQILFNNFVSCHIPHTWPTFELASSLSSHLKSWNKLLYNFVHTYKLSFYNYLISAMCTSDKGVFNIITIFHNDFVVLSFSMGISNSIIFMDISGLLYIKWFYVQSVIPSILFEEICVALKSPWCLYNISLALIISLL